MRLDISQKTPRGKIDHMLHMFMSLALDKLAQSVQTQELRAMALLVVVAGKKKLSSPV